MTPWELENYGEGAAEGERARYRLALWQAWHGEAFHRQKRLKSLGAAMRKLQRKRRRAMTPEQIWAAMDTGFRSLGGQAPGGADRTAE